MTQTIQAVLTDRRRVSVAGLFSFFLLLLGVAALLVWSEATRKLDGLLHDSWVLLHQRAPPEDVVIVAIDDGSLDRIGRWPWPRRVQTAMFERLADADLAGVAIDLAYVEPARTPLADLVLADAIGRLPDAVLPVLTSVGRNSGFRERLPITPVLRAGAAVGHTVLPIDSDGLVRRVYLKAGFRRPNWPTLALALRQRQVTAIDEAPVSLPATRRRDPSSVAEATTPPLPGRRLPTASETQSWVVDHEVLVPFYGPRGSFTTLPAARLLGGDNDGVLRDLAGKVVFVGMTATGLADSVPTAVSALDQPVSGVEVHATLYAALRDGSLVTPVDARWSLVLAGAVLPLLLFGYSRARPLYVLLLTVKLALLPIVVSLSLYSFGRLWFPPLAASLTVLFGYFVWSWHRLEFVVRFLESQARALDRYTVADERDGRTTLAHFFEHASRHLPIVAWNVRLSGESVHGSEPVLLQGAESETHAGWARHGDVWRKRYASVDSLQIRVRIPDRDAAPSVLDYIDSLARVREYARQPRLVGSIERLQSAAEELAGKTRHLTSVTGFIETVMDNSPAGLAVWNPAGELLRANPLLFEMLPGLPVAPSLADFLAVLGRDTQRVGETREIRALMFEGHPWQTTHSDGELELIVNFRTAGERLVDRLVTVAVIDVSEIRSFERSRAEMLDYLTHDLRTPLISALYLLDGEELERESAIPSPVLSETAVAEIAPRGAFADPRVETNIRQSLSMMDDLLHVARADSLTPERFRELLFNAVIDNAIDQLSPQARARGIDMRVEIGDDYFWMQGDAASLERAVVNVLGNAIKYSFDGGQVRVRAAFEDRRGPTTGTPRASAAMQLVIEDDGVGIDPALGNQLFQRFRRDPRTAARFKGIGLGLALVARVISEHNGRVSAESLEPGTRVTIRLPVEPDD